MTKDQITVLLSCSVLMLTVSIGFIIGSLLALNNCISLLDEKIEIINSSNAKRDTLLMLTAQNVINLNKVQ